MAQLCMPYRFKGIKSTGRSETLSHALPFPLEDTRKLIENIHDSGLCRLYLGTLFLHQTPRSLANANYLPLDGGNAMTLESDYC